MHPFRPGTQGDITLPFHRRLHRQGIEARHHRSHQAGKLAVAPIAFLRQAPVHQHQFGTVTFHRRTQVRPQFGFQHDHRFWIKGTQEAIQRSGQFPGTIHMGHPISEQGFHPLRTGGCRRGHQQWRIRIIRQQPLDHRHRRQGFPHRHRMHPETVFQDAGAISPGHAFLPPLTIGRRLPTAQPQAQKQ